MRASAGAGGGEFGTGDRMSYGGGGNNRKETQEESLLALVEHRTKEVEHLRNLITHYQTQVVVSID